VIDELHAEIGSKRVRDLRCLRVSDGNEIDAALDAALEARCPVVVCATSLQLLKKKARDARFDLVVIDEASQMRLPEAALAIDRLAPGGRLVLCGDGEQLGPILHGEYPEREEDDPRFDPTASVFVHALRALRPGHPARVALSEGRRMNDVLTSLPSTLIYGPELAVDFRPATPEIAKRRLALRPTAPPRGDLDRLADTALDPGAPLAIVVVEHASPSRESEAEALIVGAIARALKARLAARPPRRPRRRASSSRRTTCRSPPSAAASRPTSRRCRWWTRWRRCRARLARRW
jgi:superfamily I DNA and/or RNA helicase